MKWKKNSFYEKLVECYTKNPHKRPNIKYDQLKMTDEMKMAKSEQTRERAKF